MTCYVQLLVCFTVLCVHGSYNTGGSSFYNTGSSSFHNRGSSSYSVFSHSNTNNNNGLCPAQTDHSAGLLLSNNPTNYPALGIESELLLRPDLLNCLIRVVVLPTAAKVPVDGTLSHSKPTCPSLHLHLWSYFRYGGRCWIMQNFQEMLNYTVCGTTTCQHCGDGDFFSQPWSAWSSWGATSSSTSTQGRCLLHYQYVSVWAFCEGLTVGAQIQRERIIVPTYCQCRKVQCATTTTNSYPGAASSGWFWGRRRRK